LRQNTQTNKQRKQRKQRKFNTKNRPLIGKILETLVSQIKPLCNMKTWI